MLKQVQITSVLLGLTATSALFNAWADFDPKTGEYGGDVSAQTFAQYCRGDLPAERKATFNAELQKAEQFAADRNTDDAQAALSLAWEATHRGGAYDDTGVRCLGEGVTRHWLTVNLALWRLGAGSGPEGIGGDFTGMYVAAADGGTDGIIATVSPQPAREFRRSVAGLEGIVSLTEGRRSFGTLVLPEEDVIANATRAAVDALRQQAEKNRRTTLASEEKAFNRPPTEQELAAVDAMSNAGEFANAIGGGEIDTATTKETVVMNRRVQESQELLREARDWNFEIYDRDNVQSLASSQRAGERGEFMLTKANDPQFSLGARDRFYRDAERYFEFGGFSDRAATAESRRAAIQPELQAERDRQKAALEKAAADFESKGEDVQKAIDDMQKNESEKPSFIDEADALEAELGF